MENQVENTTIIENIPFIDITKYRKFKENEETIKKEDLECVWSLDNIHDKPVEIMALFNKQIKIPICPRHYTWHCAIMTLVLVGGMDVLDVIAMSRDECMAKMVSKGLIPVKE